MSLALFFKLLHVFAAIAFFCGLVGRMVTFLQAGRTRDLPAALALLEASEWFERRLVIPIGAPILLFGLLAAWQGGWPLFGFLQGADSNWLLVSLILLFAPAPMILFYLLPARRRRGQAAEAAAARGEITPELSAALHDRGVLAFRTLEFLGVMIITVLMVTKPF
jgi:uncharacterized membrane protein